MGGLAGPARACLSVRWIEELSEASGGFGTPLIWLVRLHGEAAGRALKRVPASRAELADAAALADPHRAAARLIRLRLLRALAAQALAVRPDAAALERTSSGGLALRFPESAFASTAGRGGWAVLALARHPIGVDVETFPPEAPVPLDLLHPAEQAGLAELDPAARDRAFLRIWTAKEAYAKAASTPLDQVLAEARVHEQAGARVIATPAGRFAAEIRDLSNAVAAAVAT